MVKSENYKVRADGVQLVRTYSDAGMYIERDGNRYADAIDPEGEHRNYTETDVPIVTDDDEATAEDYEAALNEMGVGV